MRRWWRGARGRRSRPFAREGDRWTVTEVTNQSTGYCPDVDSWPAVAAALERAGLGHPGEFSTAFAFRRCPDCRERNLVKDDDFHCAVCGTELPRRWNIDPDPHALPVAPAHRQRLDFLLAAHELTSITRVNRLLDGSRSETSAEHSWHLALAALALAPDAAPTVDLGRVVAMLLIHDLPEVYAGDVPIYDEQARLDIVAAEEAAAGRLFAKLPAGQDDGMLALWHEFERAETDEARFAKAVDRLQPLLLHWASDGAAWAERRVTVAQERRIMAAVGAYWPALAPVATALVDDAHRRGMLVDRLAE